MMSGNRFYVAFLPSLVVILVALTWISGVSSVVFTDRTWAVQWVTYRHPDNTILNRTCIYYDVSNLKYPYPGLFKPADSDIQEVNASIVADLLEDCKASQTPEDEDIDIGEDPNDDLDPTGSPPFDYEDEFDPTSEPPGDSEDDGVDPSAEPHPEYDDYEEEDPTAETPHDEDDDDDDDPDAESNRKKRSSENLHVGIYQGARWCDKKTNSAKYGSGSFYRKTDACCRDYESCQIFILPGETKYGVTNEETYTIKDCACDRQLRACLKRSGTIITKRLDGMLSRVHQTKCLQNQTESDEMMNSADLPVETHPAAPAVLLIIKWIVSGLISLFG